MTKKTSEPTNRNYSRPQRLATMSLASVLTVLLLCLCLGLPAAQAAAAPATVWVDDDYTAARANDGHTWAVDAFATLQEGVDAVADGGTVNIAPGTYKGAKSSKSVNVNATGPGVTIQGASPAWTQSAGSVSFDGQSFTVATDDPTILVTGGTLTMSNCTIDESTGFDQVAFKVTAGTLVLNSGNTVNINGAGSFIRNEGANPIAATGNTWKQDGTTVTDNFAIEDKIFHALDSSASGPVTWVANNVFVTASSASVQRGIAAASAGFTVNVGPGTFTESGQIAIAKNLTIIGAGIGSTVLKTDASTTAGGNVPSEAWVYLAPSTSLKLASLTLDGTGYQVHHAVQSRGTLTMVSCEIKNIKYADYLGRGVVVYTGTAGITNVTMSNIERIGVHVRGGVVTPAPAAIIDTLTYTGKGSGTWLDYGVELGAGGTAEIYNSTITACTGVASDGSTSAGVMATTYFGSGTTAKLIGNTITGNTDGVMVGYDSADTSAVLLQANNLTGNLNAGINMTGGTVDAGQIGGTDITGLGISSGGNNLTGYGPDNAAPWAILNSGTGTIRAFNDNYGTFANVKDLLSGTVAGYSQSGALYLACPPAVTVQCVGGVPAAATDLAGFVAQGGVASASVMTSLSSADVPLTPPIDGTITRTYSLTDVGGNSATCAQTITVHDTTAPTITSPANVTRNVDPGTCQATGVVLGTPVTGDNCAVAGVVNDHPATTFPVGTTTVTWTVTDSSGLTATAQQTVTVNDNELPVVSCKPATVDLDANGQGSISVADVKLSSSDNCGIATETLSQSAFTICDVGTKTVTLTVTDIHGNSATCDATVTVVAPAATPSVAYVDASYGAACAQVTFPAGGGSGQYYVGYNAFNTIQAAVDAVADGGTVHVAPGTYAERVVVAKPNVTVEGAGTTSIVTGTTSLPAAGVTPAVFKVAASGVTISKFKILVDFAFNHSGVHSSGTCTGITVADNLVVASASATPAFGYGLRNAIAINPNITVVGYALDNVGYTGVSVTGNIIERSGSTFFRAGIQMDLCAGSIIGNTSTAINHDFISRFANQGAITVVSNAFYGGGAQVGSFNGGAGAVTIAYNLFDNAIMQPATGSIGTGASLRLIYYAEVPAVSNPVTVSGNTFQNHRWAVSVEDYQNVVFDNNTFTPKAGATDYIHMTFNTKIIASTSAGTINMVPVGATLTRNTFNGSGTPGGTALAFYNHRSTDAVFGTYTLGTAGNENTFNAGIARFLQLDASAGPSSSWVGFGEYAGVPATTMAPWPASLDAKNNYFDVGSGLALPSAMSLSDLFAVEDRIQHQLDNAALGLCGVKALNVYVTTSSGSIQRGIDAASAGDTVNVAAGTYTEGPQIVISKNLNVAGQDSATTIIQPAADTGNSGNARGWWLVNSCYTFNLSGVTLDGNGKNVYQGIRNLGNGTISNVHFTGIGYPGYMGTAVAAMGACGAVNVYDSRFDNIGRVGVIYFGAGTTGAYARNIYTGKGSGDRLDYGVEIGGGGVAAISDSVISACQGVASVDGSTSASILATTYFGSGTSATVDNCILSGNSTGIAVGYDGADTSAVVARNNDLRGNSSAGVSTTGPAVDAQNNWWGSPLGPTIAANAGGNGVATEAGVDFSPWLGLGTDTSASIGFQPNPAPIYYTPHHLVFSTQPGGAGAASLLAPQPVVQVIDENGGIAAQFGGSVSLAIGNNPSGGTLAGTLTLPAAAGVATFSGLSIDRAGAAYSLAASSLAPIAGATSTAFDISNPLPGIVSLTPPWAVAGDPAFTLTVNGSSFVYDSVVRWNGADRATTYISPTQLSIAVAAADIATAATANVTVFNTAPGGGESAPVAFEVKGVPSVVWVDDNYTSGGPNDGHLWGYDAFDKIQDGVNRVAASGTVNVGAGTYIENITIPKSLHLLGAGTGTVIYPAQLDVGQPNPDDGPSFRASQVIVVAANNVEIGRLTIDGDNPSNGAGVDARNGIIEGDPAPFSGLEVHHCVVKNIYLRAIYPRSAAASNGFYIHDNTVDNVQGGPSSVAIFNFGGSGIFSNNVVTAAGDAISANHSAGTLFLNNRITNCASGVHTDNAGDGGGTADAIRGNIVVDETGAALSYGIWVFVPYLAPTVETNTVIGCGAGLGAFAQGAPVTTVFKNNLVDGQSLAAGTWGVYVSSTSFSWGDYNVAASFTGNFIRNNLVGCYIDAAAGKTLDFTAYNNLLEGNTTAIQASAGTGTLNVNASGNWWGTTSDTAIAALVPATVDFTPYLHTGADVGGSPADGFQGDFSALHVSALGSQTGSTGRIQEGIDLASAGTLYVQAGTYVEAAQVLVNKDLSIIGAAAATTIIKPAADTGSADDSKGWFLVGDGRTVNFQQATFDGTGRNVYQAIRHKGTGAIADCVFANIQYEASGPAYQGTAIGIHTTGNVDVTGCSFSGIGRNGVAAYDTYVDLPPTGPTGTYSGNTYVGKGAGNWLDYAFLVQGGARLNINNNQVSDCVGVATVDGSGSCGVAIWDDPGTAAALAGNTLANNTAGIALALWTGGSTDPQVTIGAGNTFIGGEVGVDIQNVSGAFLAASPALTIGASTFQGQTDQAIRFQAPISAGASFDISSAIFKTSGGVAVTDNFDKEDLVYHALDAAAEGLLVWNANNVYVTPLSASIQRGVDAASAGWTVNVKAGAYTENVNVNKPVAVSPGASPAQVTLNGNLVLSAGSSLVLELNGLTPGANYDQLIVNGTVNLGGATLTATSGFSYPPGSTLVLIANDGTDPVVGTFAGLANGATVNIGGQDFTIFYNGGDGNDVVLFRSGGLGTFATVYVNNNFANPVPGQDPDGAGPAHYYLYDSFPTIQQGVNAVQAGGTVQVAAGTYSESQVLIAQACTVQGQGAATTIIDAGCGTGLSAPGTVRITAPGNVTFDGFTVKNPKAESVSGKNTRVGIFASSPAAGDVYTIEHNIILGCNNPADPEDYGFYAYGGLGTVLFRTNETHLVSANPILIERHPGATEVSYNAFDRGVGNSANDAYFNMNYGGADVTSLQKVHHNIIDMGNDAGPFDNDHRGMGITFAGSFNSTEAGGYSQVVITENQITNLKAYRRGIGLWNNAPAGNPAWGDITGAVIERNTLSGPATVEAGSIGIRLLGQVSGAGIRNNAISSVATGVQARNWNTSVASDTVIFNNSFASSTIGLENQGGTALDASGNWWGANTEAGVASSLVGPADCTPWLDSGADLSAAAGFQGDFSFLHVSSACPQTGGGRIQEAINLLADGALTGGDRKVDVLAGYYLENVVVNKAASVLGPNAGVPATGTRAAEAVVRSAINDPGGNQPILSIEHSNVRIAGLKLDGASGLPGGQLVGGVDVNGGVGIQNGNYASLVDVDHVTIENNIFRNHTYQGVYIWNTYGLNSSGNYIRNNSFDNMWEGVQLYAMHARITDNLFGSVRRGLSVHQVNTAPDAGFEPVIAGNTVNVAGNLNVYTDGGTYGTGIWVNGRKQDAPALVVSGNTVNAPNPMPTGKIFVGLRIWDVEDAAQLTFQNNQVNGNGAGQIGVNAWLVTGTQPPVITGGAISGVTVAGAEAQTYDADPDWGGHHDVALIVDAVPMTLSSEAVGVRAVMDPADPTKTAVITVRNNTAISGGAAGVQVSGANASAKIIDNPASITGNTVGVDVDAGKAILQNNNLAGNTLAAIRASNGAIVDAGQCGTGGTDVTGLGISTGGNVLSGYGFDGAAPWAILNLNSGTPSVLACNDDFGAAAGQSIAQVVSGNVFYTQAGSLLASITPALTVQCLGEVPAGALTEAGFLAAGGVASASPVTVSFADGPLTPGPIEGTITRTYTVTDGCGTSATCSQTITVNDTTFPLITAPAPVTLPADPGACGATGVALGTPVTSDNCGIASVSNNAPATFLVGTTLVTWTVTDLHGNQSTATQTVTVQDTQPPTLAAPANIVQAVDAGQTYATVTFTLPAATDNCGIASVVSDPASPHQFSIGTNLVSVVATDVHGNTSGATFTVAVVALPSITTQPVSRTNYAGSTATFTVAATSPAPLSYQWKKGGAPLSDGGNIAGATTASLSIANVSDADAGLYTVEVSNLAGSVTSDPATLTVFNPPIIASQPQARTNNASTTATFTVALAANSTPPLAYQWFKNGTNVLADAGNVSGATTGTLTLANVLAADAGEYSVTISNEVGTVTSTNALLTVIDPVILEQPMDVVAPLGSPVSFTVTAAGTAPLSYQWYQSGVELPGETAATLALGAIVDSDQGFYSVVVSNSIGSVASIPAALLITHPPVITVQPASQIANQGDTVIFDVSANGTVPFSYQWSKGGVPLLGETSRQLVLAGVAPASEGSYQVTITNVDGAATSAAATLTVIVPPVITLEPVGLTNNAGATAVFSVTVAGSPATYSWFKNGTNLLSDGGKISGATSNILTLTDVLGADGGQYSFVASNRAGIALSSNAVLAVIDPIITTQPVGLTVNLGDPATLTVAAYGTTPAYQWRLNGAPINGATSATLHIASASAADAGHYDVVVTNQFGTVTSDVVVLAVIIPPHITVGPASLTRNAGQTAVFTVTVEGTAPFTYQWRKAGVDIEGATTDTLTLTGVSQADATTYTVYVSNPAGKDLSDPATLTVIDPPVILAQPQSRTNNATTVASFAVTATGTAPAYQWLMNGTNLLVDGGHISGAASAVLTLSNVLAADRGGYSVVLSNAAGAVTSSIAALFVVDPAIFTQPVSQTNVTGGSATFTVTAAGTPLLSYQWYQGATALFGRTASSLTLSNLSSSDAGNYTVVVTGPGGSITSAPAYLATFPPLIVTQPVSQTVNQGQPASFSVSVNGLTPFTYQWQRAAGAGSWTNVPSATNRIYSVASAQASDAGDYRVVVTNPVGSETSQAATLTVIIPPTIATQPASQTNVVGSTVTFTVGVNGSAPFAYQWKKGAADMANQTNATLVLAGITAADAATYSVVVTNPAGTATSLGASLTVVAQPALTILSYSNGKATLSLTATAGYRYGIQATTNFVDWTSLVTNVAPYTFIDTNAGSFSQRYYRGFLVP